MPLLPIRRRPRPWRLAARCLGLSGALAATLIASPSAEGHSGAHTHGQLDLAVAIDSKTLTIRLESPLDNFLGFERAPRNDDERRRVATLAARLNAADQWLRPDPVAQCRLDGVEIESALAGLGGGEPVAGQGNEAHEAHEAHEANDPHEAPEAKGGPEAHGHADIDVTVVFTCPKAEQAGFLDITLFPTYPRLQRIDARIASPQGQFRRSLAPGATRLQWAR